MSKDGFSDSPLESTPSVAYYFSDHLKTASVITDSLGSIKSESDYYPWGGELQFVANDSNHYKFTGKERDETGLDYFGARYYSNGLARFITPDWAEKATAVPYAEFADPQSLNLYGYVRNNPLFAADLDGHDWWGDFGGGLYDSTVGPIAQTVAHPINTAVALGHAAAHPINTSVAIGHAAVATAKAVPLAMEGQSAKSSGRSYLPWPPLVLANLLQALSRERKSPKWLKPPQRSTASSTRLMKVAST
jgi:RHS repeat-associated protein